MPTSSPTLDATSPGFGDFVTDAPAPPSILADAAGEVDDDAADTEVGQSGPRSNGSLRRARKRRSGVRLLRHVFAACMVIQVALVLGFSVVNSLRSDIAYASAGISNETIRIERPVFDGKDAHNSRYQIVSDAVVRRPEDLERLLLENPVMTVRSGNEVTFVLSAQQGVYHREDKTLDLAGEVMLTSATGYEFETSQARMFLRRGIAEGQEAVTGVGPMGTIDAQSFRLDQNERWVVFEGNADTQVAGTILQASEVALRP